MKLTEAQLEYLKKVITSAIDSLDDGEWVVDEQAPGLFMAYLDFDAGEIDYYILGSNDWVKVRADIEGELSTQMGDYMRYGWGFDLMRGYFVYLLG